MLKKYIYNISCCVIERWCKYLHIILPHTLITALASPCNTSETAVMPGLHFSSDSTLMSKVTSDSCGSSNFDLLLMWISSWLDFWFLFSWNLDWNLNRGDDDSYFDEKPECFSGQKYTDLYVPFFVCNVMSKYILFFWLFFMGGATDCANMQSWMHLKYSKCNGIIFE